MLTQPEHAFTEEKTPNLVALVKDAAEQIRTKGESAFDDFSVTGSRWRQEETYIFVLDSSGNMLVHIDPELKNKNLLNLRDINGKPIIRGLIDAATSSANKQEGWFHYQWPVPGGLLPRWKSSFVQLVTSPSGNNYIVGSGMYTDTMERPFVVDMVQNAVVHIEKLGAKALPLFHDPSGPFLVKDAYIFVYDMSGVNLSFPPFPNLEGCNLIDAKDQQGKYQVQELLNVANKQGSGWVDYLALRPGESVFRQKSAYVTKTRMDNKWIIVGSGIYLDTAPAATTQLQKITAPELMSLVREGAALLENQGEKAYPEFRKKESKFFHDDTYFFVFTEDCIRAFHAADPASEGQNDTDLKDIIGRPIGQMILDVVKSPSGEGWVHYLYPEPESLFPVWKSTFVKKVIYPSGRSHIVGSGIYNMQMDKTFIEEIVNRAAALISEQGPKAFSQLRDKKGPFVFMDTYVFVNSPDGTELVNSDFPMLEGRNLIDLKDLKGQLVIKDEINEAMNNGSAWMDFYWFKPGQNTPARKQTYVKKVQFNSNTYIVGSGLYPE